MGAVDQGQRGAKGLQWDGVWLSKAPRMCGSDLDSSLEWEE